MAKMTKEEKVKVFEDTVKIVKQGYYQVTNEKTGETDNIYIENALDKDCGFESYPYDKECKLPDKISRNLANDVSVVNMDCLECAVPYFKMRKNILMLNMASFHTPGGGVLKGSSAQEEELFRRTNLFTALYPYHKKYADMFDIKYRENKYPLDAFSDFGCIYTEAVTVLKGKESDGYKLLGVDERFDINVITIPAIKLPTIKSDGTLSERDRQITKNKIEQIFNVGAKHNNDVLILSAFGCGAYGNPPSEIASIFKEVIESEKYYGIFDKIIFAILDDHNTFKEHNKEGNFKVFSDILG